MANIFSKILIDVAQIIGILPKVKGGTGNAVGDADTTDLKHLPNTIANLLTDHNKVAHDALGINADTVDTKHASDFILSGATFGGDLTGTYLNLTIDVLKVTNEKIANATIDLTAKVTGLLPLANMAGISQVLVATVGQVQGNNGSAKTILSIAGTFSGGTLLIFYSGFYSGTAAGDVGKQPYFYLSDTGARLQQKKLVISLQDKYSDVSLMSVVPTAAVGAMTYYVQMEQNDMANGTTLYAGAGFSAKDNQLIIIELKK